MFFVNVHSKLFISIKILLFIQLEVYIKFNQNI